MFLQPCSSSTDHSSNILLVSGLTRCGQKLLDFWSTLCPGTLNFTVNILKDFLGFQRVLWYLLYTGVCVI